MTRKDTGARFATEKLKYAGWRAGGGVSPKHYSFALTYCKVLNIFRISLKPYLFSR